MMGLITDPPGHPGYGASIDNRGVAGHEFSDYERQIAALTASLLIERGKLEKSDAENDRLATMCGEQFTRIAILDAALEAAIEERDKAYGEVDAMRAAAQAVIDRWDTPLWKDGPATATYINRLRAVVAGRVFAGMPIIEDPSVKPGTMELRNADADAGKHP